MPNKQEEIREGIQMMDEFWATDGRSRRVVGKIGKLEIKHTDLGDDIVRKNWESAEAWLNRRREKIREDFRIFIKGECSPTYDGRYTFSDSGKMTDTILSYLHSQGVVIKVDKELPNGYAFIKTLRNGGWRSVSPNEVGYVAVERL